VSAVKRLQIMIEEELHAALGRQAAEEGVSKPADPALRGRTAAATPPIEEDPIWQVVGIADAEPVDDIDAYLFGPRAEA
jgi:hypothetical protein